MAKKRYLVTGAAGRLGMKFVEIVCQKNIDDVTDLRLLDLNFSEAVKRKQKEACTANINVEWIVGRVTDRKILRSALQDVDVVVHMASIIDFRDELPGSKLWEMNVQGTKNLIDGCCQCNVSSFVNTSSSESVGPNTYCDPMYDGNEDTPYRLKHVMFYGETKHEAEKLVLASNGRKLNNGKSLTTCSLRPGGIYGGADDPFLIQVITASIKTRLLRSPSDPSHLHTRILIDNAAWCHVLAARQIQVCFCENAAIFDTKIILSVDWGNAYFIGDNTPNLSYLRLNQIFQEPYSFNMHHREPFLPYWLMYSIFIVMYYIFCMMRGLGFDVQIALSPANFKNVCTTFTFSHKKFTKDFDYKPLRSWEESLEMIREELLKQINGTRR
ncbi:3 beta-hydroxysteroid dehydrogenase type 7-like [Clavelina lepadiformis]|uniref:3 beta-hydroxysteroid dehydrogenase type 7-like n=1 Tax=Clavelina lepadiformis TaxID=159417 RepID=UPI00404299C4